MHRAHQVVGAAEARRDAREEVAASPSVRLLATVRGGEVANPATENPQIIGVQRGLEMLSRDPRFDATAIQTLDAKGYDGIAIALVV